MPTPPATWENATPVFGIRYPKPTAPAKHLPDMFQHTGLDVESALIANNNVPPGLNYRTGTNAERLAATPVRDQIWVESDTGDQYIGTGTAWIRLGNAGTNPGTVVRVPASIAVGGSGTGSIVGNVVRFTAASSISLNGVFAANFDAYEIEIRITAVSVALGGWLRLRAAGADLTTAVYGQQQLWNSTATATTTAYSVTNGWVWTPVTVATGALIVARMSAPASTTSELKMCMIDTLGQNVGAIANFSSKGSTGPGVYDGFSLVASTGNFTGYVRVLAKV